MNVLPPNEIIVLDIAGNRASVVCQTSTQEHELITLGFVHDKLYAADHDGIYLTRPINNVNDQQAIVCELVRLNALFSDGSGWSPSAVLHSYRDQGIIKSSFRVITWTRADNYFITEH